jgi:hypothetical protein
MYENEIMKPVGIVLKGEWRRKMKGWI